MALLVGLVLSCGESGPGETRDAGPSPLLAMDGDRLWVLLQAARVNPRCRAYYADPADPRVAGLGPSCAVSERSALEWLHANGAPTARAEHLREAALWEWYVGKAQEIADCREVASTEPHVPGSGSIFKRQNACDPYDRIVMVERKTLEESGFNKPKD